ncbi:MAG: N-acetylmuramic acid 6-phosphate etherase [Candidatus Eremiobacteraeota bacterium]|nr:N-acetylmuramic acid 6-phosphate etherase [Candidatus Eremiobacteraeota bacterium]
MPVNSLNTEKQNEKSANLDIMSAYEIVQLMNSEDMTVAQAVGTVLPQVARAVEMIAESMKRGGRLIYVGAGTSGRLALLDASECPPTFGAEEGLVVAVIAGGDAAVRHAVEGAEDDSEAGGRELRGLSISAQDVVVGITASGKAPFVAGALAYARREGAHTVALACNSPAMISSVADVAIEVPTGPEVLTGSTRLKAGTAQKMVLNMLSTASMVLMGKVYRNYMISVKPLNSKLVDRACRILAETAEVSYQEASRSLKSAGMDTMTAFVMLKTGLTAGEAVKKLKDAGNSLRAALGGP